MNPVTPEFMNEIMGVMGMMLGGYAVTLVLSVGFSLLLWILRSLGLYTAAHRRGIKNPWMAWVPVAELWILGSLSDQYHYVARGQVKNRRKWLIALSILYALTLVAYFVVMVVCVFNALQQIFPMIEQGMTPMDPQLLLDMMGPIGLMNLLISGVYLWLQILEWMCLHSYFASADPGNKTVYTVIGILISVTMPFFIFVCRNKDGGMPPRKSEAAPAPVIPAPVAEEPGEEEPVNKF